MHSIYTNIKVNNEIELCEIEDGEYRKVIEKELLKNRISYFLRWPKKSIFSRKNTCIICVHDDVKETASEIVKRLCDDLCSTVSFMYKKTKNDFL